MKIEINFEIGDKIWFIHPKTMKATQALLKGVKCYIAKGEENIEYNLHPPVATPLEKMYVWNIFKTKEDLIKSL